MPRGRARAALLLASLAVSLAWAAPASANGRYPSATELVIRARATNELLVRSTFGVLLSRDSGSSWTWLCESAVGYGTMNEDPSYGFLGARGVITATFEGLAVSPDDACSWAFAAGGLTHQVIIDLLVRADDPDAALALTSSYAGTDSGAATYDSQLYATTDDGTHWAAQGTPIDPTVVTLTVEVAPSDPHRIYVSGVRSVGATRTASLFASADGGKTWTEHPIALDLSVEDSAYISAVDRTNPARVYLRTAMGSNAPQQAWPPNEIPARLLVTSDGGATFTSAFTGKGPLYGFALSADGGKIYVGGYYDGVHVAPSETLAFSQTSDIATTCLLGQGTTLYACADVSGGFLVGRSTDDGTHFAPLLARLCDIRGPIACPAGTSALACNQQWPMLETNLECSGDAGAPTQPSPPSPVMRPSGGCSTPHQPAKAGGAALLLIAAGALVGRARPPKKLTPPSRSGG